MDCFLQIADLIKKDVGEILSDALQGRKEEYLYRDKNNTYVRWGLVQRKINERIEYHLTCDYTDPVA